MANKDWKDMNERELVELLITLKRKFEDSMKEFFEYCLKEYGSNASCDTMYRNVYEAEYDQYSENCNYVLELLEKKVKG